MFTSTGSSLICHTDVVIHSRLSSTQTFRPCQATQPPKFLLTVTPRVRNTQPFPPKTSKLTILLAKIFTQFSEWNKSRFLYVVTLFQYPVTVWQNSAEGGQMLTGISRCLRNKLVIQNERLVLCVALSTSLVYLSCLTPWQIFCSADHDLGGE